MQITADGSAVHPYYHTSISVYRHISTSVLSIYQHISISAAHLIGGEVPEHLVAHDHDSSLGVPALQLLQAVRCGLLALALRLWAGGLQ